MRAQLQDVATLDPVVHGAVTMVLMGAALSAALVPARRVARRSDARAASRGDFGSPASALPGYRSLRHTTHPPNSLWKPGLPIPSEVRRPCCGRAAPALCKMVRRPSLPL